MMTASDGADALEKVRQCRPDVIVTDGLMPGMDGFALLRRLRDDPATGLIPVIMLTAESPADAVRDGSQPQPDAFVAKAANMEPLLGEVRRVLGRA